MWLQWFLRYITGEDRFVTIDQLYRACNSSPLEAVEAPKGGWPNRREFARFFNEEVSVFYREDLYIRPDKRYVETLDIKARAQRGVVWVTFVNDEVRSLTHNARRRDPAKLTPDEKRQLWQILLKVRAAAA